MRIIIVVVAQILAATIAYAKDDRGGWPVIQEKQEQVEFSPTHNAHTIEVRDGKKQVLYILDARIPNESGGETRDYDYSGAFDCRLYSVNGMDRRYGTLLTNERGATRDWQTDGRFLPEELLALANAPKGRALIQRSRLRGMLIEIEVSNVALDPSRTVAASFSVVFRLKNDPTATSDIAAPP